MKLPENIEEIEKEEMLGKRDLIEKEDEIS